MAIKYRVDYYRESSSACLAPVASSPSAREPVLYNGLRAAELAGSDLIRIEELGLSRFNYRRMPVIIIPAGAPVYKRLQRVGVTPACPKSKSSGLSLVIIIVHGWYPNNTQKQPAIRLPIVNHRLLPHTVRL